jgi:ATP-binding cassette, subfamily B (MDR/TAP), member 1
MVLKDFNVTIKPGEIVALVGESGSGTLLYIITTGKSTTLGLLERFYEPIGGVITIDGVDIKELDPQWLHTKMVIVTQEPVLFEDTIENNILYGNKNATFKDVLAAAKAANAHNFIKRFPAKYKTVLGERGVSLSGISQNKTKEEKSKGWQLQER